MTTDAQHARFAAWLADGALDDPPRDGAVHASGCAGCLTAIAALDRLSAIQLGAAPLPPRRAAAAPRRRPGLRNALLAATVGVAALVTGVLGAPLLTAGRPQATPQQQVLAATGTPAATATGTDSPTPSPTPSPTGSPSPSPRSTVGPYPPPPSFIATPRPTVALTARPTATPFMTPSPPPPPPPDDCVNGIDDDGDGAVDGADPGCALDGNEASADPPPDDCVNGIDDDGDGAVDAADPGCALDGNEASADPPPDDCVNGIDDDGDTFIDVADPGCVLDGNEASA